MLLYHSLSVLYSTFLILPLPFLSSAFLPFSFSISLIHSLFPFRIFSFPFSFWSLFLPLVLSLHLPSPTLFSMAVNNMKEICKQKKSWGCERRKKTLTKEVALTLKGFRLNRWVGDFFPCLLRKKRNQINRYQFDAVLLGRKLKVVTNGTSSPIEVVVDLCPA